MLFVKSFTYLELTENDLIVVEFSEILVRWQRPIRIFIYSTTRQNKWQPARSSPIKNMILLTEVASQHILMPYFTEDRPTYEHSLFLLFALVQDSEVWNLMTKYA